MVQIRGTDTDRCPIDVIEEDDQLVTLSIGRGAIEELRGGLEPVFADLRTGFSR